MEKVQDKIMEVLIIPLFITFIVVIIILVVMFLILMSVITEFFERRWFGGKAHDDTTS